MRGHYIEYYLIGGHIYYCTGGRAVQEDVKSCQAVLEYSPVLPNLRSATVYLSSDSLSSSTGFLDWVVRGGMSNPFQGWRTINSDATSSASNYGNTQLATLIPVIQNWVDTCMARSWTDTVKYSVQQHNTEVVLSSSIRGSTVSVAQTQKRNMWTDLIMKQKMRKPSKVYVQNALHGLDALWVDCAGGVPTSHRNLHWTANLAKIDRFSMAHFCMYTIVLVPSVSYCFPR